MSKDVENTNIKFTTEFSQLEFVKAIRAAAPTRSAKVLREAIAVIFWVYVILKLFVYDIDVYLAERFAPEKAWLLDYKFFILLCCAAIIALTFRSLLIFVWIIYD